MTTDRKKLTPPQRRVLDVLAELVPGRPGYLSNETSHPYPKGATAGACVHAGSTENLARRGLVEVTYMRHGTHEARITEAGREKLADLADRRQIAKVHEA